MPIELDWGCEATATLRRPCTPRPFLRLAHCGRCLVSRPNVQRDRYRPIVDQRHLHVGAKFTGSHHRVTLEGDAKDGVKERPCLLRTRSASEAGAIAG